ncbi:golgi complex component [Cordyceps militaris CM01]|uniref:Golgi complex component n=1 Tax=Cordyceps militaris (strain CM01) TaxID=983644 RepID=G3JJP0_CORMM|nr:golgi complex component [Cordyceps militaris CM01]EGX91280.1 golgi complex component [Cordyceps militaris CM01]
MADSEHQPAAAPEQSSDDVVAAPAETEAVVAVVVNGGGDVGEHDDADVPQLETGDGNHAADDADDDASSVSGQDAAQTPTRHRPQQHLAPPQEGSELGSVDADLADLTLQPMRSPVESLTSAQGISPSIQGSHISSPGSSVLPSFASRAHLGSPTPSFRPFDRRFSSRIASPGGAALGSPRSLSPAFLGGHSRSVSLSSNFHTADSADTETTTPPWEVVRWTRLQKLNAQAFSESGRRNFGSPTCLAVSASIVLGTSKGIILVFDYGQNLKLIMGPGTKAVESGPVTAIAISADHTTIAGGHADGSIFTWDTSRPSRPFLSVPHLESSDGPHRTADGHVANVSVIHLGFLGTRHTALVSADDRGMAFSHLATRGTGALGRTVRTTRILGRYPDAPKPAGKHVKPSTVLAFASLPLGNVECATDILGLTAMLTPYLLVIVSTTPIAQTQHKSARPKDVPAHSTMTGCLAWFPAVKLKTPDPATGSDISKVKLAYCWSNLLTVLDVSEVPSEDDSQPPTLRFKARSRWKCEEAIVAVQWLSRSVITVLTVSQRLIVLEDRTMRMTEAFDLMQRYMYHKDLYSKQLHNLVEQLDEEDTSMHGVVADAFYMSFKAYKGRIFILGFNEISLGALSNWADRLIAMMEHGDYIGAIQLATSYYTGDADKLTVGLPEDQTQRHGMVKDKVLEIIRASLRYAFTQRQRDKSAADDAHLKQLAETCFVACLNIGNVDFLLDDMFTWYEDADVSGIFLEVLEPYILDRSIAFVPPIVVKDMVSYYAAQGWESRLEEMICHMETATLDLDQVTLLCKQHSLYDALTYVWNQAIRDYVTPMIELLSLLVPIVGNGNYAGDAVGEDYYSINAVKIFPYLSYILTSRVYPNGEPMDEETATQAKAEIYWFFFSGQTITWPKGSGKAFLTHPVTDCEPSFPYLRLILHYDAPSFLSALNEAFEDPFLNDSPDKKTNGASIDMPEEQIFGQTINRQYIMSILLDVMNPDDFAASDTIYLDMFIARNLPKFPQYLLFSGSTLSKVLEGLCNYPGQDLAEDAQLSAEYLLSVYHPTDTTALLPLFKSAGFYRILKRIFKVDKQFGTLIRTYFEDPDDQDQVFECLASCLRPSTKLGFQQRNNVHEAILDHARDLLELSPEKSAVVLAGETTETQKKILDSASDAPYLQFSYLKTLLDSEREKLPEEMPPDQHLIEQYVRLMCKFEPLHVSDYINRVQAGDLRLDQVLPTMEENGVVDAAVTILTRDGLVEKAMQRLVRHFGTLESALQGVLSGAADWQEDPVDLQASIEELLQGLQKYMYVGIWLCQGQRKQAKRVTQVQKRAKNAPSALTTDESLWLQLIEAAVKLTKQISPDIQKAVADVDMDGERLLTLLRSLVQHTFTALLASTSGQNPGQPTSKLLAAGGTNLSFLRVLRAFLTNAAASSPNLADLRGVLASIFSAYAYEESILRLSNRLLDRSLFVNVSQSVTLRQRGWRPRGSTCEHCGRRVWGPGVAGGSVFEAWEARQALEDAGRLEKKHRAAGEPGAETAEGKGKGKSLDTRPASMLLEDKVADGAAAAGRDPPLGPLVVLACRHVYHQSCLDAVQDKQENGTGPARDREYRCPIDG